MTRAPSNSARTVAFAVAFGALAVAAGCGQETFDLLPGSAPVVLAGAPAGAAAGSANLGGGGSGRGGAPGSGNAGAGGPSKAGAGGFAGHFGNPSGGSAGGFACLSEGGCPDEEQYCPTPCGMGEVCNPFTQRCAQTCKDHGDCADDKEHLRCLTEPGVCVTCIWDGDCMNFGPLNDHCFLNACVQCSENWHCTSQQICVAGRCIRH